MSSKKIYVVLSRNGEDYNISFNLPLLMLSMETGESRQGFEKVKNLELPRPMTSNQFNKFITSKEGKAWSKEQVQGELE